jgi:hypothetical protein
VRIHRVNPQLYRHVLLPVNLVHFLPVILLLDHPGNRPASRVDFPLNVPLLNHLPILPVSQPLSRPPFHPVNRVLFPLRCLRVSLLANQLLFLPVCPPILLRIVLPDYQVFYRRVNLPRFLPSFHPCCPQFNQLRILPGSQQCHRVPDLLLDRLGSQVDNRVLCLQGNRLSGLPYDPQCLQLFNQRFFLLSVRRICCSHFPLVDLLFQLLFDHLPLILLLIKRPNSHPHLLL